MIMLRSFEQIDHVYFVVIDMEMQLCRFNLDALAFFWGGIALEGQKAKIMAIE